MQGQRAGRHNATNLRISSCDKSGFTEPDNLICPLRNLINLALDLKNLKIEKREPF